MLINGRMRQACSALVEQLLAENPDEIELRPMSKFPVVRDLVVNRHRLFRALEKVQAWMPVDGYYAVGPGPRQSQEQQEQAYPLMQCMSCGCCLEACPQYAKVELVREPGETDEQFAARERETYDRNFVGAHAISQVVLYNAHPTGALNAGERLDALTAEGGIQNCGNAAELRGRLPQGDSAHHLDRQGRPAGHRAGDQEVVRPLALACAKFVVISQVTTLPAV